MVALTSKSTFTSQDTVLLGAPAAVAGAYTPVVEVPAQTLGGAATSRVFQEAGYWPLRRCAIVTKEAKDQVRSMAERGTPVSRLNCSDREPFAGVYSSTMATKLSAYAVTASMI